MEPNWRPLPYIKIKWPAFLVMGNKITEDQAAEIIVRTTRWPCKNKDEKIKKILNDLIGPEKEIQKYIYRTNIIKNSNYIGNDWVDWDGTIFFNGKNIGPWPSVNEISSDWENIAKTFPFLELHCQVMNKEYDHVGDSIATAQWEIKNGKVRVFFPENILISNNQLSDKRLFSFEHIVGRIKKGIELSRKISEN